MSQRRNEIDLEEEEEEEEDDDEIDLLLRMVKYCRSRSIDCSFCLSFLSRVELLL